MSASNLPPIENYPAPATVSVGYQYFVKPTYMYRDGSFDAPRETRIGFPALQDVPETLFGTIEPRRSNLSWLEFYQKAVVKVRHPDRFEGDTPGPWSFYGDKRSRTEKISGELFPAAARLLATDATAESFTFSTMAEILEQGIVPPFTVRWLERFSEKTNMQGHATHLAPLLPLLDKDLRDTILANKFTNYTLDELLENPER